MPCTHFHSQCPTLLDWSIIALLLPSRSLAVLNSCYVLYYLTVQSSLLGSSGANVMRPFSGLGFHLNTESVQSVGVKIIPAD